jgi:tRNA A-37 threonylcarbamoyl transferase component Bud32
MNGNPYSERESRVDRILRNLSEEARREGPRAPGEKSQTPEPAGKDDLVGVLAVRRNLIDAAKLEEALREQAKLRSEGTDLPIGQILVQKGWLTPDDFSKLLAEESQQSFEGFHHARYELQGKLGEGATSVVYRAWDREVKRPVAIKVLRESAAMSDVARERFHREAQAAGGLSHPNVVVVYDVGEAGGRFFIALELVDGRSLGDAIRKGTAREELLKLLIQASRGVAAAHARDIVHRDLKPQNILVTPAGEAKVGDFGLAHLGAATLGLTRAGSTLGTPLYMAPEQVKGDLQRITPRTDVYALGAILFEILNGTPPHTGDTVVELYNKILSEDPTVPAGRTRDAAGDLQTVALKALDKDPSRRYPTAHEFAEDLKRALEGEPIQARPEGEVRRLWRRALKKRHVLLPLALAAVVGTGIAVLPLNRRRQTAAQATDKARDFARTHPDEVDAQIPLWKDALLAAVATPYETDVRREYESALARQKDVMKKELSDLDLEVAALVGGREYRAANKALEAARTRRTPQEWILEVGKRSKALEEVVSKERARAEYLCRTARQRGAENEVVRMRGEVERWGIPQALLEFDRTLLGIPLPRPLQDPALVGYWALDEGKGNEAADATGKLVGRIQGASWAPGRFGSALEFGRQGSVLELPNSPELDRLQEANYTVVVWVKPKPTTGNEIYAIIAKPGRHTGIFYNSQGRFFMVHWLAATEPVYMQVDSNEVPGGEFHHVASVLDRASGLTRMYVDGQLRGERRWTPGARSIDFGRRPWRIGCAAPEVEESAKATIDEIRLYSRALSAAEIEFLYWSRPATATTWSPVFDGKSTAFLSTESAPCWKVEDGALVHAPCSSEPPSGRSKEEFGDGEFRFRLFLRNPMNSITCAVRGGSCRLSFPKATGKAGEEGEHEVIFLCRGNDVSATLDGKPATVELTNPVSPRGCLEFHSKDALFRMLSIEYRALP